MIIGNNSDFFRNPGRRFGGLSSCQIYSCIDTGSKKNTDFFYGRLNSIPEGYGSKGWRWPTVLGSMSTYNNNPLSIIDNINNFALGYPVEASITGSISNNAFQIALLNFFESAISSSIGISSSDLIVLQNIQSSITGNIQISNADLSILAAILLEANITSGITFSGADLGMVFDMIGNISSSISSNNALTLTLDMGADIGGADPLSPQGLAEAVWSSLLANYQDTGTFGKALADALASVGGGDPVAIADEIMSRGILTTGKFIALK